MSAVDKARLDPPDEAYSRLPKSGAYLPKIGSALITMVEPHVGHEWGYNRWYEDDHFNAGAMAFPWMFAGRRWVAPTWLQALRYPDDSPGTLDIGTARLPARVVDRSFNGVACVVPALANLRPGARVRVIVGRYERAGTIARVRSFGNQLRVGIRLDELFDSDQR